MFIISEIWVDSTEQKGVWRDREFTEPEIISCLIIEGCKNILVDDKTVVTE